MSKSKQKPALTPGDPYQAHAQIARLLEKCGYEGYAYIDIFRAFLDVIEISLDALPYFWNQVAAYVREHQAACPPAVAATFKASDPIEARFAALKKRWKPQTLEYFSEAYAILLTATTAGVMAEGKPNYTYADCLGNVFMEFVCPSDSKFRGQFFTPWTVARMMAEISLSEIAADLRAHIDAELAAKSRYYKMAQVLGIAESMKWETKLALVDQLGAEFEPYDIADPAGCGSGIMLLASASLCPRWAIERRYPIVRFFGMDIDATCVQMARINLRLYGLNGSLYELRPADGVTDAQFADALAAVATGKSFVIHGNALTEPQAVDARAEAQTSVPSASVGQSVPAAESAPLLLAAPSPARLLPPEMTASRLVMGKRAKQTVPALRKRVCAPSMPTLPGLEQESER